MNYPKLFPDIKAKWLEALRSGNFPQGFGAMKTCEDKYCCLGVCVEAVLGVQGVRQRLSTGFTRAPYEFDGIIAQPNLGLVERMFSDGYTMESSDAITELIKMNDELQIPFPQIADWIEVNL